MHYLLPFARNRALDELRSRASPGIENLQRSSMFKNIRGIIAVARSQRRFSKTSTKMFHDGKRFGNRARLLPLFLATIFCAYLCLRQRLPPVEIVIVTQGAFKSAQKSLKLLRRNTVWRNIKLQIVDAGSPNFALDWYAEFCRPSFCTLTTMGRVGYTKAAGFGIEQTSAEHVVLMHPDVEVCYNWLPSLFEALERCNNHAVVGPLSNSAGYQSVPKLPLSFDDPRANARPKGMSLEAMCRVVSKASPRDFPDATLLDGFLLLFKRSVFDVVNGFDATNFPDGLGEQDFLLRVQNAGYSLVIADNTYAYHHHATDMAHEHMVKAVLESIQTTKTKHGSQYQLHKDFMQSRIHLLRSRRLISQALAQIYREVEQVPKLFGMNIVFVLPVRGAGGGVISIVHIVNTMRQWGLDASIAVRHRDSNYYRRKFPQGNALGSFAKYSDEEELGKLCEDAHFVVATIYTSVKIVLRVYDKMPHFVPAYFIQDYEAWFSGEGSIQRAAAIQSYELAKKYRVLCFAKTNWIRDIVMQNHGLEVSLVTPSLDHNVHSKGHCHDRTIHVSAMVRMKSSRRSPEATLSVMTKLKETFGDQIHVTIFGSKNHELRRMKPLVDMLDANKGAISDEEVAKVLQKTDIFIDLSVYQAFGRTAAECMASGCVPVVPGEGGAIEMLDNGRAGISVNTSDHEVSYRAIRQLVERGMMSLRQMKLHAGIKASEMSTEAAAKDVLFLFISEHFTAQQNTFGRVL